MVSCNGSVHGSHKSLSVLLCATCTSWEPVGECAGPRPRPLEEPGAGPPPLLGCGGPAGPATGTRTCNSVMYTVHLYRFTLDTDFSCPPIFPAHTLPVDCPPDIVLQVQVLPLVDHLEEGQLLQHLPHLHAQQGLDLLDAGHGDLLDLGNFPVLGGHHSESLLQAVPHSRLPSQAVHCPGCNVYQADGACAEPDCAAGKLVRLGTGF